jgi:hypothetical protein
MLTKFGGLFVIQLNLLIDWTIILGVKNYILIEEPVALIAAMVFLQHLLIHSIWNGVKSHAEVSASRLNSLLPKSAKKQGISDEEVLERVIGKH